VLTRLPGAKLVALAETDATRRAEAARRAPQAKAVASYQELLAMPEVEAVVIALPTFLHAEVALAALQHGKHIYLEKPLATSCAEGQPVIDAWQRTQLVGMIGFNYRFHALYQMTRQQISAWGVDTIVGARATFSGASRNLPDWKKDRKLGGGALLDLGVHHVDLIEFLFRQSVVSVYAEVANRHSEADTAWLQVELANGLTVQLHMALGTTDEDRWEIMGEHGTIIVDRRNGLRPQINIGQPQKGWKAFLRERLLDLQSPYLRDRLLAPGSEPSFGASLVRFAAAVRNRQIDYPSLHHGYRALQLIELAEESARLGRPIRLDTPETLRFDQAVQTKHHVTEERA
jgi:predicted dehydrogenase